MNAGIGGRSTPPYVSVGDLGKVLCKAAGVSFP